MITCGFFNSVNGDRTYNAEQMNNPYKRIISNGVFARPNGEQSDDFKVYSTGEMSILVNKGDGIFDGKWATNDSPFEIVVPAADVYNARIDSIVFRVNYVDRIGEIILIQGEASENLIVPAITRNDKYVDYRLANIFVSANAVAINNTDITDTRASSECGFVTHLLEQADITTLYSQWQAQFENWFLNLKETIATTTIISSFSSKFIATEKTTKVPINVTNYNSVLDILQVYKNGLLLVEGFDYVIDNFNEITLTEEINTGTQIAFVVYKSVDGSEAESFVRDMEELFKRIKVAENSLDTLDAKLKTTSLKADKAELDIVELTTKTNTTNSNLSSLTTKVNTANTNIASLDSRVDELERVRYSPLWEGANQMGASASITPSKKLDNCRNGWILVWSGYNTSTNKATETRLQFTYVPKNLMANLTVESMPVYSNLIYTYYESGNFDVTAKLVTITNDKITGFVGNVATDFGKGICLMAVMEW